MGWYPLLATLMQGFFNFSIRITTPWYQRGALTTLLKAFSYIQVIENPMLKVPSAPPWYPT